jgi:hypothetical protein
MQFFSAFRKPYVHPAEKHIIRRQVKLDLTPFSGHKDKREL